jgi:hypothetical protein
MDFWPHLATEHKTILPDRVPNVRLKILATDALARCRDQGRISNPSIIQSSLMASTSTASTWRKSDDLRAGDLPSQACNNSLRRPDVPSLEFVRPPRRRRSPTVTKPTSHLTFGGAAAAAPTTGLAKAR